jgi:hypothetical protein
MGHSPDIPAERAKKSEGFFPDTRRSINDMKTARNLTAALILSGFMFTPFIGSAAEKKPKPYPLKTCVVSEEKLGGHGKPYVFTHEGREIKMCCKACVKDFNKDTAKYIKKLEAAEKKASKS